MYVIMYVCLYVYVCVCVCVCVRVLCIIFKSIRHAHLLNE